VYCRARHGHIVEPVTDLIDSAGVVVLQVAEKTSKDVGRAGNGPPLECDSIAVVPTTRHR